MWENGESINAERSNHDQLVRQFNACVERTDGEVNMLEEYIDCVRDGLVNFGGFVRHTSLTRQQRDMFTQERANGVLFRMRQREPDVTDPPVSNVGPSGSGLAGASSSSAAAVTAPVVTGDTMMLEDGNENGEESPTTDDEDMENADPSTR